MFGILTTPTVAANGTALLCLHAGAQNLTSHKGRVYTRLCREAAGVGYTSFRMDFHGSGDSSGTLVDRNVSAQTIVDVEAAVQWLTEQGAQRIVIVGTCWGALVALVVAARQEAIVSACLISPPLRLIETGGSATQKRSQHERLSRAVSRALRPHVFRLFLAERQYRTWVLGRIGRRVARGLRARPGGREPARRVDDHVEVSAQSLFAPLLRRRVPLRVLFGEQDPTYRGLLKEGTLSSLEAASQILDIEVVPATVHGLTTVTAQDAVLRFVMDSLARDAQASAPAASR